MVIEISAMIFYYMALVFHLYVSIVSAGPAELGCWPDNCLAVLFGSASLSVRFIKLCTDKRSSERTRYAVIPA